MPIKYEALLRTFAVLAFMQWTGFADIPTWVILMPLWILPVLSILSGLRSLAVHILRGAL